MQTLPCHSPDVVRTPPPPPPPPPGKRGIRTKVALPCTSFVSNLRLHWVLHSFLGQNHDARARLQKPTKCFPTTLCFWLLQGAEATLPLADDRLQKASQLTIVPFSPPNTLDPLSAGGGISNLTCNRLKATWNTPNLAARAGPMHRISFTHQCIVCNRFQVKSSPMQQAENEAYCNCSSNQATSLRHLRLL